MTETSSPPPSALGVLLLAAGSGTRFGAKKQFVSLAGKPLFAYSLEVFARVEGVDQGVIVACAEDVELVRSVLREHALDDLVSGVVAGGPRRQDSVRNGLDALSESIAWVVVHDAARPLVTAAEVRRFVERLRESGGAAIGYPSSDSVKEAEERSRLVRRNLRRERVWLVQTPQGGRRDRLVEALAEADRRGVEVTDEAAALELVGEDVELVEGSRSNIKVTRPEDLELARFLLARRSHGDDQVASC